MKLSVRIRYRPGPELATLGGLAEDLGFHGVWVSEPWGFDAGPALGWLAARTANVLLGTHVASVFARTPAATAGLAASLERPIARTRDTITAVRTALRGDPLVVEGDAVRLPLRGKPLRFAQLDGPLEVPIYLGALGPANRRLTAELADGWTPTPYSPDFSDPLKAEPGRTVSTAPVCPVAVGPIPEVFALERGWSALYLGGMGTPTMNFYAAAARRMGFGAMVDTVQERWSAGDRSGARAAVCDEYVDSIGLFGPVSRIRQRLQRYDVDELILEPRKPDAAAQADDLRMLVP